MNISKYLKDVLSNIDTVRNQAYSDLMNYKQTNIQGFCTDLANFLTDNNENPGSRQLSAVVLKNCITVTSYNTAPGT